MLAARVGQEISDDAVQPLRLASDDLQQLAVLFAEVGNAGKHAHRTGDGGERIADFVSDGCRQTPDRRQAVLHAHIPLQTPDFGQVIEGIDVTECCPGPGTASAQRHDPKGLAKTRPRSQNELRHGPARSRRLGNGSRKS